MNIAYNNVNIEYLNYSDPVYDSYSNADVSLNSYINSNQIDIEIILYGKNTFPQTTNEWSHIYCFEQDINNPYE